MEESVQLKEICGYLPDTFGSRFQWRQVNGEGKREIGGFVGITQCLNLCWSHNTQKSSENQWKSKDNQGHHEVTSLQNSYYLKSKDASKETNLVLKSLFNTAKSPANIISLVLSNMSISSLLTLYNQVSFKFVFCNAANILHMLQTVYPKMVLLWCGSPGTYYSVLVMKLNWNHIVLSSLKS